MSLGTIEMGVRSRRLEKREVPAADGGMASKVEYRLWPGWEPVELPSLSA